MRYEVRAWYHEVKEWAPRKGNVQTFRREWCIIDTEAGGRMVMSSDAKWPMESAAECYNEGWAEPPADYRHVAVRYPGRIRHA